MINGKMAKMPEDHWVSLDAGVPEGWFLTKPWHYPGLQVLVNADAKGGSIEVELLTPYGEPVEGFTRQDCVPVTGNGKDQELKWKGMSGWDEAKFLELVTKRYRGGLLAKFYLKNAKVYSYTVTEPDPEGAIARHWANFRWCEHIKHRSDSWGRTSNEPAGGVSPHGGPGPKYLKNIRLFYQSERNKNVQDLPLQVSGDRQSGPPRD